MTSGSTDPSRAPGGLNERPAGGLYLISWLLTGLGIGLFFFGSQAGPPLRGVMLIGGLILLIAGLASAAGYQTLARRSRPATRFRGPSPVILFVLQVVAVNAISLALLPLGLPGPETAVGFLLATIILLAGYAGVVWLFGVRSGALAWRDMGLRFHISPGRVAADIVIAASTMLFVALVAAIFGGILAQLLDTAPPEVVPVATGGFDVVLVAIGAALLVPIGEELFFRGYSITAWMRDVGPRSALLRSTVFFALVHILNIQVDSSPDAAVNGAKQALLVLSVIGPVGLGLGWLFLRRGLIAAIAGHAAFNLFGVLVTILAENLPPPPT
ncbi:MAG TPA: CPBP family intramembrane glutamic endopeptidase [Candidatus Limnocylindrales bacterium]|nr:CPBP family intramembrane glutamic endopeptidase [Candidatus Limnocylindrales bacterium]